MHLLCQGNALRLPLADKSVHMCITSPPYWGLRDYGTAVWQGGDPECDHKTGRTEFTASTTHSPSHLGSEGIQRTACSKCGAHRVDSQLGLEPTPGEYIAKMVAVFREVWRVLRDDGTCWVNIGDSYATNGYGAREKDHRDLTGGGLTGWQDRSTGAPKTAVNGLKPKDLVGIPWRLALALQADGWYLRSDIIWAKPNPMPESVTDRPTKSHEYLFLLSKSERYYFDADAVRETAEYGRCGWDSQQFKSGDMTRHHGGPGSHMRGNDPSTGRNLRSVWTIPGDPTIDVYADGMSRITSPDCPVHGCPVGLSSVQRCDELPVVSSPVRSPRIGDHPWIDKAIAERATPRDPSGLPLDLPVAIRRNTRKSKKAAASKQDETCDDTPVSHTECTEHPPHCTAISARTPESSTSRDVSSDETRTDQPEQSPENIEDTLASEVLQLKCTCNYMDARPLIKRTSRIIRSVFQIPTEAYPGSHFATFARKLVEPCIKAGTSEKGCCPVCGKSWERVMSTERIATRPGINSKTTGKSGLTIGNRDPQRHVTIRVPGGNPQNYGGLAMPKMGGGSARQKWLNEHPYQMIGWRPGCEHTVWTGDPLQSESGLNPKDWVVPPPVPCVVFDPFIGSGTTIVVANALGRQGIGLDLSADYLKLARQRITRPHAAIQRPGREESHPLFDRDA